jgi:hypothetical protein
MKASVCAIFTITKMVVYQWLLSADLLVEAWEGLLYSQQLPVFAATEGNAGLVLADRDACDSLPL